MSFSNVFQSARCFSNVFQSSGEQCLSVIFIGEIPVHEPNEKINTHIYSTAKKTQEQCVSVFFNGVILVYTTRQMYCNTLQHTATHCNTLQHTATHYKVHLILVYTTRQMYLLTPVSLQPKWWQMH